MNYEKFVTTTSVRSFGMCNSGEIMPYLEEIKDLFKLGFRVLDVGCGGNPFVLRDFFKGLNCDYIGIDTFEPEHSDVFRCDAHEIAWPDSSFNVVLSFNSLEHMISPAIVLSEISRVLKTGGLFIVALPVGEGHDITSGHYINLTRSQLLNLFNHFGLRLIKERSYFNINIFIADELIKKLDAW